MNGMLARWLGQDRERLAERARHAVYGSVIVLAVIIALDDTSIGADEAVASVIGAAVATVFAELYADYLGETIRAGRPPTREERSLAIRDAAAGMLAALLPVIFFVLALLDVLSLGTAFNLSVWTGIGVVGFYAFVATQAAGHRIGRGLAVGLGFTLVGALLVAIKAVLH